MSEIVTISQEKYEAILDRLEDLEDRLAIARSEAARAAVGEAEHRRLSYTLEEAQRITLHDVSPVTVWRERAGMTQRRLADAAGVAQSYLAEIEAGRKAGSVAALRAIARALDVSLDILAA